MRNKWNTFKIKKGVFFHDDPCFENGIGRELNTDDVIFTFEQLFTNQSINTLYYEVLKDVVNGADSDFKNDKLNIYGIKKVDNYQVK